MRRAIFLDRDGVLNAAVLRAGVSSPPINLSEFRILPGVADACAHLRQAGFLLIVVTNQPDVRRGSSSLESVEAINREIRSSLPVDDIRVCYHDDIDQCSCRKPKPGLLLEAAADWQIDLSASFMVGDRWKDIEAGNRAGCRTVLIHDAEKPPKNSMCNGCARSLADASRWILLQPSPVHQKGK